MRGRHAHHCNTTVYVRNIELDVVFEGILDFDEGQFEVDDVYLQEGREKISGPDAYKIPPRLYGYIIKHCQEDAYYAAWGEA
jgi:RNA recognition motif-containing protein